MAGNAYHNVSIYRDISPLRIYFNYYDTSLYGGFMKQSLAFNLPSQKIETELIALGKKISMSQYIQPGSSRSLLDLFFRLLSVSATLMSIEYQLYRIIRRYHTLLIKHPPADPLDAQARMETLSFVLRTVQEIMTELGHDAEKSVERVYLSRVSSTLDSLLKIWDEYSDITNADILTSIKEVAGRYLVPPETNA